MIVKTVSGAVLCVLAVAGCTDPTPPSGVSSAGPAAAPSGITSSNGGGQRQLNNLPSVGISQGQSTVGPVPNARGNAY